MSRYGIELSRKIYQNNIQLSAYGSLFSAYAVFARLVAYIWCVYRMRIVLICGFNVSYFKCTISAQIHHDQYAY